MGSLMKAILLAFLLISLIGEVLRWAHLLIGGESWFSSALLHTIVSMVAVIIWLVRGRLGQKLFYRESTRSLPHWLQKCTFPLEILALSLVVGSVLIAFLSASLLPVDQEIKPSFSWSLVFWVPLVEEICYRGVLGDFFLKFFPGFLGIWFSSIIFAVLHLDMGIGQLLTGQFGIPLGPFFLGLISMTGYYWTRTLSGPVLFHCAANSTVYIFLSIDPRWLDFLSPLYSS